LSAPKNLTECYTEELADNWSANDQMQEIVRDLAKAAGDKTLRKRLEESAKAIGKHTDTLKKLLKECGETDKEHCKGMEGLVKEAKKHALSPKFDDPDVRDVVIIAQYQRMCHYGICGFGTAKAFAQALGKDEHVKKLDELTADAYGADENMSDLAQRSVNLAAKDQG